VIAFDGRTLAFCEVKSRRAGGGSPWDALREPKQRQVRQMAIAYLSEVADRPVTEQLRFDAVGVVFDARGRLLIVDFADPLLSEGEQRPLAGLEQFRDEDYRGPLVFRVTLDPTIPLPRRLATSPPLFPRARLSEYSGRSELWGCPAVRSPLLGRLDCWDCLEQIR